MAIVLSRPSPWLRNSAASVVPLCCNAATNLWKIAPVGLDIRRGAY